jgi:plastocyanin
MTSSLRGARLPAILATLLAICALLWIAPDADAKLRHGLGIDNVSQATLPGGLSISLSAPGTIFEPEEGVVAAGGWVTFRNSLNVVLLIRSTVPSPTTFSGRVSSHGQLRIQLSHPGLYHYYDARTAEPLHIVANNEVLRPLRGSNLVGQGWIAVLPRVPSSPTAHVDVPAGQDLFSPKALVTVVGSTIILANHDADAHNFVIDPASPAGAAFIIGGTDQEPPHGWQRSLVIEQAGLYHVYCTMHTRVIGMVHGWHIVVPRFKASGYKDHNSMDAWIIALPILAVSG